MLPLSPQSATCPLSVQTVLQISSSLSSEHTSLILICTQELMTAIVSALLLASCVSRKLDSICHLLGAMSSTEQGHSTWQYVLGVAMVAVVVKRKTPLIENTKKSVEIFRRVQAVSFCGCFVLMGIFVIIKCLLKWKVIFLWEMIIVAEDKVCKRVLISPLEVAIVYIDDKDSH